MTLTRRRFLTIAAAFAATPAQARSHTWRGRAFGAEVSISLTGPRHVARQALDDARRIINQMEHRFSLFRPASELARLNRTGRLEPSGLFLALMRHADTAHRITGGRFDPTVQPLWQALAEGRSPKAARGVVGWGRLRFGPGFVRLAEGQALTFNGIAQGFATDTVTEHLSAMGFSDLLVNIGEYRATGGRWTLGVEDPRYGVLATRRLAHSAIATSSPGATMLGQQGHIMHVVHKPHWSTVTVEADSAVMADALSTGLVLADLPLVRNVRAEPGVRRITLIDRQGDLVTL